MRVLGAMGIGTILLLACLCDLPPQEGAEHSGAPRALPPVSRARPLTDSTSRSLAKPTDEDCLHTRFGLE
jgi:hypothetical protein